MLSVVRRSAEAAEELGNSPDLAAAVSAAAAGATAALAGTPQQLAVLAEAGVVDAGGCGLVIVLDALAAVITGQGSPAQLPPARSRQALEMVREAGSPEFGYEVQYLLHAAEPALPALKAVLAELGDSLVVVGSGDGLFNVHVHVNDVGAAIEAGVEAGRPHRIAVTRLEDRLHADDHARHQPASPAREGRGAVVVAAGDGLTALFEAEGATVVDRNPSIAEMLDAIAATGAAGVVLLPNDANTHAVAISAAREAAATGVRVSVVPTRSPVQALAALAVRDAGREFGDDVIAMAEAAGACRYGEVCTAQREALTVAGRCRPGDLLGLVDGEVHIIGDDLTDVARRLIDRMLGGGGELTTLVLGADAPPALQQTLCDHVTGTWPFAEVQCYAGGQPRYHLLVGVE
jgi:DAK2 domain fusion protein YloV